MEKPLVLRTYVPSIGIDYDDVLPNHARGLTSPKYSPSTGKESNSNYLPIDGVPAAISVNLGKTLSYVWDTTECRLLYAWTDGFLDMKITGVNGSQAAEKDLAMYRSYTALFFIRHRVFILFELIKNQSRKLARPNMSVILWEKTAYHPMILNPEAFNIRKGEPRTVQSNFRLDFTSTSNENLILNPQIPRLNKSKRNPEV